MKNKKNKKNESLHNCKDLILEKLKYIFRSDFIVS